MIEAQLFNLQDRRYQNIKDALAKIGCNETDSFEQWTIVGNELRALRSENPTNDRKFGRSIKSYGINLKPKEITAAQWWSELPSAERTNLRRLYPKTTTVTSFYANSRKPRTSQNTIPRSNRRTPGEEQGQRSITLPEGDWERFKAACDDLGLVAASKLGEMVRGFIDPDIRKAELSLTAQQRLTAVEKRLDRQFNDRVQAEVRRRIDNDLMPYYKERLSKADELLNAGAYKPVFSNSEYRTILSALHPDSSIDHRAQAFDLFKQRELRLRDEEKPLASDLPMSVAELLARRKQRRKP